MRILQVFRVSGASTIPVGAIVRPDGSAPVFSYYDDYLDDPASTELSVSLPLRERPFVEAEFRPYFEGLLPEHQVREEVAARLGVPVDDYLAILALNGLDCIGDVVVYDEAMAEKAMTGAAADGRGTPSPTARHYAPAYEPVSRDELAESVHDLASLADSNSRSRLSLAGSQRKVGLAHVPGSPLDDGWLRPLRGAASTHILKTASPSRLAESELVCTNAAGACGIDVAETDAILLAEPVVVSERYDRVVMPQRDNAAAAGHAYESRTVDSSNRPGLSPLQVLRLHQEDMAQALGIPSADKYVEVEGGSYRAVARLLGDRSLDAAHDLDQLARIAVYDFLVGNCDNHLKNLSVLHVGDGVRLAPAYDIVCTTFLESEPGVPMYSRTLGMRLGSAREIDDVGPDDFALLADDLGIGRRRMARICAEIAEVAPDAIDDAGERFGEAGEAVPFLAEDLREEMGRRLEVVRAGGGRFRA